MPLSVIFAAVVVVATPDGATPPATLNLAFVVKVPCPVTETAACTEECAAADKVEEELVASFPMTFTEPLTVTEDGPVRITTPMGMDTAPVDNVAEEDKLTAAFTELAPTVPNVACPDID